MSENSKNKQTKKFPQVYDNVFMSKILWDKEKEQILIIRMLGWNVCLVEFKKLLKQLIYYRIAVN